MKQRKNIIKQIRTAVTSLLFAGTMLICGNTILAEASMEYGTELENGSCAGSVTWAVYDSNEDGDGIANTGDTLVFDGKGSMGHWLNKDTPWVAYKTTIKTVIFKEGASITSIGSDAFRGCTSLKNIIIPKGITIVAGGAFQGCESLESIVIPEGVNAIESDLFYGCSNLKNVTIPETATYIGNYAFYQCSSLKNITIPKGVKSIWWAAFNECSGLESVIIPEGVKKISEFSFAECSSLKSVTIPETVTKIANTAFYRCESLESINIPKDVTIIGSSAFSGCSTVKSIVIPEGVTEITSAAFSCCTSLESITIPEGVTSIEESAFSCDESLESIKLPEGITSLEKYTFYQCSSLKSITIPEKVTSLGMHLFTRCSSLESIIIPEGVTSIGARAFCECSGLKSITLPEGVTEIGEATFEGCENLQAVYYPTALSMENTSISKTSLKISYVTNEDNTVSLTIEYIPEGITTITLPDGVYGKAISSVSYAEGVDATGIHIKCTKHFPDTNKWDSDAKEHWFTGCKFCQEAEDVKEEHEFYNGKKACRCGYVPFTITAQSKDMELIYGTEEELSVEISPAYDDLEISYQWYENGKEIEGAIEDTYIVGKEKTISDYTYICKISCGEYRIASDEITVSVKKRSGVIQVKQGKEAVSLSYSKEPISLDWVTKIGDGTLIYAVTQEGEVLSVSEDGKISIKGLGTAEVSISMAETENFGEAETKNIKITVVKADYPSTSPETPMAVENTVKKVSQVTLPADWEWDSEGKEKTIPAGKTLEVVANYIGEGKEFYNYTSMSIMINRADCTASEVLYTKEGEKAPTCTSEGKGHKECTVCGDVLESNLIIKASGHTGGSAYCKKKAVCTICQEEYGELDKSKHVKETEVRNIKEASCTEKGYTGDVFCKDCGEKLSEGKETSALGHKISKMEKKEATCITDGTEAHYSCKICKKMYKDEQGKQEETESSLRIKATGHKGGSADCKRKAVCIICQKEYGELDKNKHVEKTEVRNAKKATCTEEGYTGDVCCEGCGEKFSVGEKTPALGHKMLKVEKKEATCTTNGTEAHYSCMNCKKLYRDEQGTREETAAATILPATGHIGGKADCKTKAVCDVCHETYGELDETNHSWNKGEITKEATEKETGIKTYTCSICQETKTEEIPATGNVVVTKTPNETITPEVPTTGVIPTKVPTSMPTTTVVPTQKPSVEETETPKKGTILTDKKSKGKYKILVSHPKNGTVEYVKPLNKKATKANIPATVKIDGITYKVVSIGKNAFKNHKYITKVTIGKNVKTIGANAFYRCKKLKTVSMGKNITTIGDKAFYKCTALTKITIPSKVKKIEKQCFYGCKKLEKITIKTTKLTKKNVGSKAFSGVNKKATVKVPKSKVKAYQKMLKTKGISKTMKVKK